MDQSEGNTRQRHRALVLCGVALVIFAAVSYSANHQKSVTYDETTHSVGGLVHLALGDFRVNPEDPVLFGYWGALLQTESDLKIDREAPSWAAMLEDFASNQWVFCIKTLFQTPGNDGDTFVQRSRFMFTILGVALGALIAWWAWELAGALAALLACLFFCLDPNFLAHSSIFKNDVMLSLVMTALGFALWRLVQRGDTFSLTTVALAAAAAINVKFSGVICGPIILVVTVARAILPHPWPFFGRQLVSRAQRFAAVLAVGGLVGATSIVGTWAAYQFRYAAGPGGELLNEKQIVQGTRATRAWSELGDKATPEEALAKAATETDSPVVRGLLWMMAHRLLPQPWLVGFLYTYGTTFLHRSFLLGQVRVIGWWYYFPCCVLFKTPLATLGAILIIPVTRWWQKKRSKPAQASSRQSSLSMRWFGLVAVSAVFLYAGSAALTNLNIGIRHILPVYPFLFVALGCGLAKIIEVTRRSGIVLATILWAVLVAETASAYPDYIPFFNLPSRTLGGGGLTKLGDSNLDWGQDLKGLAAWQKMHTDLPLYLAYFGTASPAFYGVNAINVPLQMGGWPMATSPQTPEQPCYFAVSATCLQAIYITDPETKSFYSQLRKATPSAILGGSIYIYRLPNE